TAAILGYFEAASTLYEYSNILFNENEFSIRLSDIRQIHTLLMRYEKQVGSFTGNLGVFRNENVIVNESRFTPLDYTFINETTEAFIKWLNKKITTDQVDKIKLAALSHLIFETIHPFRDGNGRSGRILLSFILIGTGFINIAIKGTQKSDREKYYYAMEQGDEHFELMLRKIEKGEKLTPKIIDDFAMQTNSSLLEQIISSRLEDGLNRLGRSEMISINEDAVLPLRDISKFYNYSQDYIRNLINKGKIKAQKRGKLWYVRIREIEKYLKSL
ncbi:MAG: Fic family protein, partial [Ignavibacteriota bacterium]